MVHWEQYLLIFMITLNFRLEIFYFYKKLNMDFLFLIVGVLLGGAGGFLAVRGQLSKTKQILSDESGKVVQEKNDLINQLDKDKSILEEKLSRLKTGESEIGK